ncbi:hypothetical protein VTK73DRAFT_2046 [Phialemonium thermophilum]|uniref:Uncharacterized protein n=1 Tax=Phialemonium thermophilum TaxID=223376 RepID=A0ABR3VSM3_9PEZI
MPVSRQRSFLLHRNPQSISLLLSPTSSLLPCFSFSSSLFLGSAQCSNSAACPAPPCHAPKRAKRLRC